MKLSALLTALLLAGCHFGPSVWVKETETFEVDDASIRALEVSSHNGGIEVFAVRGIKGVRVSVIKSGGGEDEMDAQRALEALEVTRVVEGGVLRMAKEWRETPLSGWGSSVEFTIECSAQLAAKLSTHNGPVSVQGLDEAIEVTTHNGGVEVEGETASIEVETHNGSIAVGTSAAADLELSCLTHNGGIILSLPENAAGQLSASWHNGGFEIDDRPLRGVESSERRFAAILGQGQGSIRLGTHNGVIQVRH